MFRVGQKVECVDAKPRLGQSVWDGPTLVKGRLYTIGGVYLSDGEECVILDEIKRGPRALLEGKPGFLASRFRPVVTRKTDISVFRALLNPVKEEA